MKNDILEEIRQTRQEIENEEGGDLRKVFERMKKKNAESPRRHYAGKTRAKSSSKTA